jgi:hypothetical protein
MKIALCLFGQPRYISNSKIFEHHQKAIYSQGDVDVFAHCWFDENKDVFDQSDWSYSENLIVDKNTIEIIEERYKPKRKIIEPQRDFTPSSSVKNIVNGLNDQRFNNDKNIFNIYSQLYSIHKSVELFQEYCKDNSKKYDFLVLTRYDVMIWSFPVLEKMEKNKYYIGGFDNVGGSYPGFNDYVHILDPVFSDSCKCFEHIENVLKECDSLCIEEIKQIFLAKTLCYPKIVRYIGKDLLSEIIRK